MPMDTGSPARERGQLWRKQSDLVIETLIHKLSSSFCYAGTTMRATPTETHPTVENLATAIAFQTWQFVPD